MGQNLIGEGKMFISNKATVMSRVGGVMHILSSCILSPMSKNATFTYIRFVSSYSEQFFISGSVNAQVYSLLKMNSEFFRLQ